MHWMEGQHVDRAPLAVDREGGLHRDIPTGPTKQQDEPLDELAVRGIEQPIQPFPAPAEPKVDLRAEAVRRIDERPEAHATQ